MDDWEKHIAGLLAGQKEDGAMSDAQNDNTDFLGDLMFPIAQQEQEGNQNETELEGVEISEEQKYSPDFLGDFTFDLKAELEQDQALFEQQQEMQNASQPGDEAISDKRPTFFEGFMAPMVEQEQEGNQNTSQQGDGAMSAEHQAKQNASQLDADRKKKKRARQAAYRAAINADPEKRADRAARRKVQNAKYNKETKNNPKKHAERKAQKRASEAARREAIKANPELYEAEKARIAAKNAARREAIKANPELYEAKKARDRARKAEAKKRKLGPG